MSKETTDKKAAKKGGRNSIAKIYTTYRGEFSKIVWPGRPELIRKTITVAIISGIFGIYISTLDGLFGALFTTFVGLTH
ncbi:MAG: preprotein translocase subunit SecE [Defluviitaleaceae bacterium]|nr:preprotein translocase subunit SecE [Defluviitaleaceae bacterium]